jgi:hypothetical protein
MPIARSLGMATFSHERQRLDRKAPPAIFYRILNDDSFWRPWLDIDFTDRTSM